MSKLVPVALRYQAGMTAYDRRTTKALMRHTNRIALIGDVARAAMDEMAVTYVTAQDLTARALTTAHCIQSRSYQSEETQAYCNTLTQHFLQGLVFVNKQATVVTSHQLIEDPD